MTTKFQTKAKSRILDAVYETASDLHRLGLIGKCKMSKFDALCLNSAREDDSDKISTLRESRCGSSRK
jgi:putative transcriptional regulator